MPWELVKRWVFDMSLTRPSGGNELKFNFIVNTIDHLAQYIRVGHSSPSPRARRQGNRKVAENR